PVPPEQEGPPAGGSLRGGGAAGRPPVRPGLREGLPGDPGRDRRDHVRPDAGDEEAPTDRRRTGPDQPAGHRVSSGEPSGVSRLFTRLRNSRLTPADRPNRRISTSTPS